FAKEILFYTHPDVWTTPQDAGDAQPENWTDELFKRAILDGLPLAGGRFAELERTLASLYTVLLLDADISPEETYPFFKFAQEGLHESKQITLENYKKIHALRNGIIERNLEDLRLLIYFIIYSDFGKSPKIRELLEPYKDRINTQAGPDDLMTEVLQNLTDAEIEAVVPSFGKLSEPNKIRLKQFYPLMRPCFGHILYYERGQKTFELIAEALVKIAVADRQTAIKLLFMAQFGDGMGAQGQAIITGSVTCTNDFYYCYQLMHDALVGLEKDITNKEKGLQGIEMKGEPVETAFNMTVSKRAEWLGFPYPDYWSELSEGVRTENQVQFRIACMIRCPNDSVKLLHDYYHRLELQYRELLNEQLSFSTERGLESWKARVDYVATTPLNVSQSLMRVGKTEEAIAVGMRASICLAMLLKHIAETFPSIVNDPNRTISLKQFAIFANDLPKMLYPATFNPRQWEFAVDTNQVIRKLSPLVANNLLAPPPPERPASPQPGAANSVTDSSLSLDLSGLGMNKFR
ncbi:MAG: hypothetical protein V4501_10955, partial [Pseudomonadota bacterium]